MRKQLVFQGNCIVHGKRRQEVGRAKGRMTHKANIEVLSCFLGVGVAVHKHNGTG